MRVLVVGSGAREHALVWKLAQSPSVSQLWCAPGNAGTAALAEPVPVAATDLDGLVAAARQRQIELVVVGPEDPLASGLADRLLAAGILVCGPSAAATKIESSKAWAKELMREAGIPTARSAVVADVAQGLTALAEFERPIVIKADGLATGKGVVVAETDQDAETALRAFLQHQTLGAAGQTVVIEECLTGQEVSIFGVSDGQEVLVLPPACDYKRVGDGDVGPNTGGMGAYAPVPAVDPATLDHLRARILAPAIRALAVRGTPFRGILYAGLMLTADGPQVLEFNARLGDPETQVVLPLLDVDLAVLLAAVASGTLDQQPPLPPPVQAAVGVVMASGGYPGPYETGLPITGFDNLPDDVLVFHAGTKRAANCEIVTAGGRVLTVVGRGPNLAAARARAYAGVAALSFPGGQFRSDIAARELSGRPHPAAGAATLARFTGEGTNDSPSPASQERGVGG